MHHATPSPAMVALCLVISILFLLGAAYVVVMNWACVIATLRNKRKGIDQHHSTVPVVSALLGMFGFIFYPYHKSLWLLAIPLADVSLWYLMYFPFFIVGWYFRKKAGSHKPTL